MGVTRTVVKLGDGSTRPRAGDVITIAYTGHVYDPNQPNNAYRGKEFDSTKSRGDFKTQIGVGKVIRGWDEGILSTGGGMTLGEKAILVITSDYAYGKSGFPGLIPPNSHLVFDVELKAINERRA